LTVQRRARGRVVVASAALLAAASWLACSSDAAPDGANTGGGQGGVSGATGGAGLSPDTAAGRGGASSAESDAASPGDTGASGAAGAGGASGTTGGAGRFDGGAAPDGPTSGDGRAPAVRPDAETAVDASATPRDAAADALPATDGGLTVLEALDVADVWSGHPVGFALLTLGDQQFAAFYDAERRMTVAQRTLGTTAWRLTRLPQTTAWDSHNYVTMAADSANFLHVSGNMHGVPLVYFRTAQPLAADTLQAATMVGRDEQVCTYPIFFKGPAGELVFDYRDGVSGNGNHIFDTYSTATRTWSRLVATTILDGQGLYNPYPVGPVQGPDGWYHMVWTWRDTADAATNHDLSYAKSQDLVHWQSAAGRAITLPITLATSDIVDTVPAGGGLINNNTKIGFDAENRPIVAYQKYDASGATQLYDARLEGGRWVSHRVSNWTYRWAFGGTGSLVFEIQVIEPKLQPNGDLTQEWFHARYGGWGAFRLDPTTLASVAQIPAPRPYPIGLDQPQSTTAGMEVHWAQDSGTGADPRVRYMLRWETLPENRDQPRAVIPPATKLRLYAIAQP